MNATKARDAALAAVRGLALALMSLAGSITVFVLGVLSVSLVVAGVGLFSTPAVLTMVRAHANQRRLLAARWSGIRIEVPYRAFPSDLRTGVTGQVERSMLMLKDPATWRDLRWLLTDMTAGAILAIAAAALFAEGLYGLLLALGLWLPIHGALGQFWYLFVPVDGWPTAIVAGVVGLGALVLCAHFGGKLLRAHFLIAKASLAPTKKAELAQRINRLTETRHEAVDASATELRRIERDLHDGAQARLVAMGMHLGTIEALMEKDPARAKQLIGIARRSSAEALTELRDLVRGIHPPVLAERGLPDAVRALALRVPIATEVEVDLKGRAEAPVESAAYFAVSESLTNVVKHSGADRIWVDMHHADGMLRVAVSDNGKGGASIGAGSGLSGIERRLGTFDGILAVSSPVGGPTMVTMEIPCRLA
jgi:signal transduction histidine kinase